jgi:hypothetical protein
MVGNGTVWAFMIAALVLLAVIVPSRSFLGARLGSVTERPARRPLSPVG